MPRLGPIGRRNLIRHLRQLGFEGPYAGSKHEMMVKGELRLRIPNPHAGDIDRNLLVDILRQAGISRDEWEKL
ncbi:MAG: type II toxin-antitoxin system HicA family toxin [Anaerolineae bacterium]